MDQQFNLPLDRVRCTIHPSFGDYEVFIEQGKYLNGRVAWEMIEVESDDPYAMATVNIPEYADARLDAGTHVIIKNWSENEGVLEGLLASGIIGPPEGYVSTPFGGRAPICPILKRPPHVD